MENVELENIFFVGEKKCHFCAISEHVITSINDQAFKQSYVPQNEVTATVITQKLKLSK